MNRIERFIRNDACFNEVLWCAKAARQPGRHDTKREKLLCLLAVTGEKMYASDYKQCRIWYGQIINNGLYEIRRIARNEIILECVDSSIADYPFDPEDLFPETLDGMKVVYTSATASNVCAYYASLIRAMEAGCLDFDTFRDIVSGHDLSIYIQHKPTIPVLFYGHTKKACLAPILTDQELRQWELKKEKEMEKRANG